MTSLGNNNVIYKTPPPYFIVLASSVKIKEVKFIEFHRISLYLSDFVGFDSKYSITTLNAVSFDRLISAADSSIKIRGNRGPTHDPSFGIFSLT